MSAPPSGKGEVIKGRAQLLDYLEKGCKPPASFRIGTEHEKFVFTTGDLRPSPYDGPSGIGAILEGLAENFGWTRIEERGQVIALAKDGCNITLEPGGQFELSGAPLETLHQTCCEVHTHLDEVRKVAEPMGVGMLGLGFNPKWPRDAIPWMPKDRYAIMRRYMPTKGSLGLDMMTRTCTVQVNLDFSDEADMVRKFRVALALQPVATAIFANSPFTEGAPNGFKSYRSHIWTDTDPDRCGMLPFVFEEGFGFERWVDYVLDVPMYFIYRDGAYLDVAGQSFRDLMAGELASRPGDVATMSDWSDHLTTPFPEVRLKRFLEMRGADAGPWGALCALPAYWVGLLYDEVSLQAAVDLTADWSIEEMEAMRDTVPRMALQAPFRGGTVLDLARETVRLSREGLARRARLNWDSADETLYLRPLERIVESGRTLADDLLLAYENEWQGDIDRLFRACAF